ncbi:MAG: hypothetical protein HY208_04595 [Nitrospirae bacterium]|nr:hypothetical protein [Nitrospirota bacterium]
MPFRNRAVVVAALLLAGLLAGCDNGESLPPDVLGYVNIDTSDGLDDRAPAAAFDGTNFMTVYEETVTSTDHDLIGAVANEGGSVLGYVLIETSPNDDRAPAVAFDGTNYLVVYQETAGAEHNIMGIFVSPAGAVGAPFVIDNSATDDDLAPVVAFDGTNYLVVYQRAVSGANGNIIGAVVNTIGTVQAGSPFNIDVTAGDDRVPAVASNGSDFLVAYQRGASGGDIRGAVIDPSGPIATLFGIDTSANDDRAPRVASDGTNYLVVYEEITTPTDRDIRGAIVDPSGPSPGTPFDIDTAVDYADYAPSAAFDGVNYLVAYTETVTSGDHDIMGARVDPAGTVLDFAFAIDQSDFDDFSPVAAFGATRYLVAYEEVFSSTDHDIFGALVKP